MLFTYLIRHYKPANLVLFWQIAAKPSLLRVSPCDYQGQGHSGQLLSPAHFERVGIHLATGRNNHKH